MEIVVGILSFLTLSFGASYIRIYYKFQQLTKAVGVFIAAHEDYQNKLNETSKEDLDESRENFIKFLSDSREWAFDYIENVQDGLKKFIKEVEPEIEYYNNYGKALEGMVAPHDIALQKISKEFQELKKLLPEEVND